MGWLSKERWVTIPQAIQEMAKAVGERLRGHDAEIHAIKEQMDTTQKEINALQTEMQMLRCQLAVAQRQSLAAKLREKGVTK